MFQNKNVDVAHFESQRDKDWHPGSNWQVLDLVHPSIYPLVYGQSKILPNDSCGVDDCLSWVGKGETILPPEALHSNRWDDKAWSKKYQWLPSEFEVPSESEEVKPLSYINNIHPSVHPELYTIIPQIIAKAIPMWNRLLSFITFGEHIPERVSDWSNSNGNGFLKDEEEPPQDEGEDDDDYWDRIEDWRDSREVVEPEPLEFETPHERLKRGSTTRWEKPKSRREDAPEPPDISPKVDLRRDYGRLQVIVKLANIHLTPEKPNYPGGSWHVEGQANESM